jgi:nicotinate-nucleotide--dimethylbenzimidazole phosphoribosyltransferase
MSIKENIQRHWDFKTKPQGSLGRLEDIVMTLGIIQKSASPELKNPTMIVYAGDHGIAKEGVSAFPQEVTRQMVLNFLNGGAAISVLCRHNGINLKIVDTGVIGDFGEHADLVSLKIAESTKSYLNEPAMSESQCAQALENGAKIAEDLFRNGCNVLLLGEMGIGNTSSASCLMSVYLDIPVEECIGKGTGLDSRGLDNKIQILGRAIANAPKAFGAAREVLAYFGGFEIATMTGSILRAHDLGMTVIADGFITTSAVLSASRINPDILLSVIFSHQSEEPGHRKLLNALGAKPLLSLNMRLGEGSGAALCYPVIANALHLYKEMSSFEEAKVSGRC